MPLLRKDHVFKHPIEVVYQVVADFESYPEFVSGVKHVKIVREKNQIQWVRYQVVLIKTFEYELKTTLEKPHKIQWELTQGELFQKLTGYWQFKPVQQHTQATYCLDIELKLKVPDFIAKRVMTHNFEQLFDDFSKRLDKLNPPRKKKSNPKP